MGCGSSICIFGRPQGQHNNGPCRCLVGLSQQRRLQLSRQIRALSQESQKSDEASEDLLKQNSEMSKRIVQLKATIRNAYGAIDDYIACREILHEEMKSWE